MRGGQSERAVNISASPHIRAKDSTGNIMLWVVIALLPATLFGIWNFRDQKCVDFGDRDSGSGCADGVCLRKTDA